ncbi:unnamed protein product [Cylicocyclus nassatus]|uniref:F-box domain-containing protein n=1 Tax=Cylicocyclus nassatus TaxID=53992 RepID=A0AA36DV63_CYLNA|nr:unnamed protein product [Cylicocyclus nassatus]
MSNPLVRPSPTKESDTNDSLNIFHRWSELPSELKIKILRYTSFHTVMRFMLLSKESYALASRTKLRIDYIQISEPERRGTISVTSGMHELLQKQTLTSQGLTNFLELGTENRALVTDLVRLLPPRCTIVIYEPNIFLDNNFLILMR